MWISYLKTHLQSTDSSLANLKSLIRQSRHLETEDDFLRSSWGLVKSSAMLNTFLLIPYKLLTFTGKMFSLPLLFFMSKKSTTSSLKLSFIIRHLFTSYSSVLGKIMLSLTCILYPCSQSIKHQHYYNCVPIIFSCWSVRFTLARFYSSRALVRYWSTELNYIKESQFKMFCRIVP